MLADLIEPYEGAFETRVPRTRIQTFLSRYCSQYVLVMSGEASGRSSSGSWATAGATWSEVGNCIAIVDRGRA